MASNKWILLLISIAAPFLGYDGGDDPADLIWWFFWAVVWVVGSFSIVSALYVGISRHIRGLRTDRRKD